MPKPKIPGVISGLKVTFKEMLSPNVTVQYPREKEPPPTRARGVIALKEENCTVTFGDSISLKVTFRPEMTPGSLGLGIRTPPSGSRWP